MVPLALSLALQVSLPFAAPSLPEPDAPPTEPAPVEPVTEPTQPEPPDEPTQPEPAPPATNDEAAPRAADDDDDDGRGPRRTVRRSEPGDWGMQFTFGGLAPLSIAGVRDHGVNRLLLTELGFRRVTKNLIIPFSLGAGVFHHNPDGDPGTQNDAGVAATFGVLKPFRVWRRIAPYVGGMLHVHYLDPTGVNNWLVNFAIGPVIGTEFFIGDRVSLLFQGQFDLGINVFDGLTQVRAATSIAAGGQTGLVFYF